MHFPHGVCESSQQALLQKMQQSNVAAVVAGSGGGGVLCDLCVSLSAILSSLPSLSHPAVVDQVTVLCAFISPSTTTTIASVLFTNPPVSTSNPLPPQELHKPPNHSTHARTRIKAAALLSGPTCSSTTGKCLLLLFVRNQRSKVQKHQVINKYRDICFSGPSLQPAHYFTHSVQSAEFKKFNLTSFILSRFAQEDNSGTDSYHNKDLFLFCTSISIDIKI